VLVLASVGPDCGAIYDSKTASSNPDVSYFDVEGPTAEENKTEERGGGGESLGAATSSNVSVDVKYKEKESLERGSVSFPYEKYQWSIGTWYHSSDGLRFYDVFYGDEQILYDYRVPWVKIGTTRYALTSSLRSDGPDLHEYNQGQYFEVWTEYHIEAEDVDIEVFVYFRSTGEMDPWVIVDCNSVDKNIVVGQRFDFDLDGWTDDNAQFYTSSPGGNYWELVEEEDLHADANNPEESFVQWRLFDTDVVGENPEQDQLVKIIPYSPDDSYLYVLRYQYSQLGGDPATYDNDQGTGEYNVTWTDPYDGEDLVAWYVSTYTSTDWCWPGPWINVEV